METKLTTHEMLKSICDKIHFVPKYKFSNTLQKYVIYSGIELDGESMIDRVVNEIEIIFTQEFMDILYDFLTDKGYYSEVIDETMLELIYKSLDNPCLYLYNLIN